MPATKKQAAEEEVPTETSLLTMDFGIIGVALRMVCLVGICYFAYTIRLWAVHDYGAVIHEFDPWFNFRATEYMWQHGYNKFIEWYDTEVWYPLGRPVGTTTYPGMMVTSSLIYEGLQKTDYAMSLNDVCVYVPAWFATLSCIFTYLLTKECFGNANAALAAAAIMSCIPAHIMRSVAGGYDNESVAVPAICSTFYFHCRSLRSDWSWPFGVLTGLSYIYMVGSWGGYVFVLNMVGVHTALLVILGRFSYKLHRAYSLFYIIGTLGAIQFPVVGLKPLKSLEEMGPMFVFFGLQVFAVIEMFKKKMSEDEFKEFRYKVLAACPVVAVVVMTLLMPSGYLGPLSARVRGLFLQHTRTGNPLVDSVAEHQATAPSMYYQYFHMVCFLAPIGVVACFFKRTDAAWFCISYNMIAYYFSAKMVRLVLLLAPACSVAGGIAVVIVFNWIVQQLVTPMDSEESQTVESAKGGKKTKKVTKRHSRGAIESLMAMYKENIVVRKILAVVILGALAMQVFDFVGHCRLMAHRLSEPSIMMKSRSYDGREVIIDDFRESYWWLRDNTAPDARVMSWWDYGYQINGVGNRTTIADGNTWNHEHIALLGKCLVSPEKKSYEIVKHLADYVLVWTTRWGGMGGDDLAKSPHMARIGGSVFSDIDVPNFYQDRDGRPSKMMAESLLYRLHSWKLNPEVADLEHFKESYTSKNRMVRIYKVLKPDKESKEFVKICHAERKDPSDPAVRELCESNKGYPPALEATLRKRKDFKQLEDFNRKS